VTPLAAAIAVQSGPVSGVRSGSVRRSAASGPVAVSSGPKIWPAVVASSGESRQRMGAGTQDTL